jgi:hypothetical protein
MISKRSYILIAALIIIIAAVVFSVFNDAKVNQEPEEDPIVVDPEPEEDPIVEDTEPEIRIEPGK